MEHSSHGCSELVVVRVEQRRVVGAAPWSEGLDGSEQRFNGLVSENYQGGYRLEAYRPGLIATCRADALHDLLAAELLSVRRPRGWDHIVPVSAGRAHGRVPRDRKR